MKFIHLQCNQVGFIESCAALPCVIREHVHVDGIVQSEVVLVSLPVAGPTTLHPQFKGDRLSSAHGLRGFRPCVAGFNAKPHWGRV